MGVSFYLVKENVKMVDGEPVINYGIVYPPNFDRTPVVDPEYPEYGALPPENPWEINVNQHNFVRLAKSLGIIVDNEESWSGLITNLADFIDQCRSMLATVLSIPAFDAGEQTVVSRNVSLESIVNAAATGNTALASECELGATFIHLGTSEGYFARQLPRLIELAEIAIANEAVISYA